jgi:hypothetical protein
LPHVDFGTLDPFSILVRNTENHTANRHGRPGDVAQAWSGIISDSQKIRGIPGDRHIFNNYLIAPTIANSDRYRQAPKVAELYVNRVLIVMFHSSVPFSD